MARVPDVMRCRSKGGRSIFVAFASPFSYDIGRTIRQDQRTTPSEKDEHDSTVRSLFLVMLRLGKQRRDDEEGETYSSPACRIFGTRGRKT